MFTGFFFFPTHLLASIMCSVGCVREQNKGPCFVYSRSLPSKVRECKQRKELYSKIINHVISQGLTKSAQFSREKCRLKFLKSRLSSSLPLCCAKGTTEKVGECLHGSGSVFTVQTTLGKEVTWGREGATNWDLAWHPQQEDS